MMLFAGLVLGTILFCMVVGIVQYFADEVGK